MKNNVKFLAITMCGLNFIPASISAFKEPYENITDEEITIIDKLAYHFLSIHTSIEHNDVKAMIQYALDDKEINKQSFKSKLPPPLHYAITQGKPEIIQTLIEDCAADINLKDPLWKNRTPLHRAIIGMSEGSPEEKREFITSVVRFLLQKSADLTLKDDRGLTPFLFMLEEYNIAKILTEDFALQVIQLFLDAGVDLLAKNNHEQTALHFAVKNKHMLLSKLLLNQNHELINLEDTFGFSALDYAMDNRDKAMVNLLLQYNPALTRWPQLCNNNNSGSITFQ
jgi:ankyrin repeat protein